MIRRGEWTGLGAFAVVGLLAAAGSVFAQEGHPLTGTWSGDWGPTLTDREHITLVMRWDGREVSGLINPGPDSVDLDAVRLDVADWTLRLSASGPDGAISAEGRLEDLESPHRTLRGTWRVGDTEGDFLLTRE